MTILEARSLVGVLVLIGIAYSISFNRRAIAWRVVIGGMLLQFTFALIVLKTTPGQKFFLSINDAIVALLGFSTAGARFLFGNLVTNNIPVGTPIGGPKDMMGPIFEPTALANVGAFFAFSVLPTIIFFAALMSVLYYFGVMQIVVRAFSWVMQKTLRTSGAETLSASANIFVGQTEAPLIIRPYLAKMTRSELFCVMTGGFATVAGGVMAAYVGLLHGQFPTIAGHLMAASVMAAPAGLVMAKIICPEEGTPETAEGAKVAIPSIDSNAIDAASRGASEGMALSINVAAMLIAFIALIALIDGLLVLVLGNFIGMADPPTLKEVFGYCFAPMAWIMGVPRQDMFLVGQLIGTKMVVNEFVAYLDMAMIMDQLSPRSAIIAAYALCGFANFSSIGIQIGGISALVPERRHDLAKIGLRAMFAGSLATFMSATIAGTLLSGAVLERAVSSEEAVPAAETAAPISSEAATDTF